MAGGIKLLQPRGEARWGVLAFVLVLVLGWLFHPRPKTYARIK